MNTGNGALSGHLRETIQHVYDVRESTASQIMIVAEAIERIAKQEYIRGRLDMYKELQENQEATP